MVKILCEFELEGRVSGGGEEEEKASNRVRNERECLSCGGVAGR